MAGIKKIAASTLVETLVAMTIIVTVLTMGVSLFVKVTTSGTSASKVKALAEAQNLAEKTKEKRSFFNEEYELAGMKVKKEIKPYEGNEDILFLEIIVSSGDKVHASHKELILAK